ncbi:MAG: hypothetical protein EOM64_05135 [Erysipelotrichia bacterium]|nr:hypothetical protein [Erysipelotrichia bacterium]
MEVFNSMRKHLIISHGNLAKGMLDTLTMFIGENKNYYAISAYADNCNPTEELNCFWSSINEEDQVLIYTDILCGSVNQLVYPKLSRANTFIFAGMNLPMLIQGSCLPDDASDEEIMKLADCGREGVVCMNNAEVQSYSEEDE